MLRTPQVMDHCWMEITRPRTSLGESSARYVGPVEVYMPNRTDAASEGILGRITG